MGQLRRVIPVLLGALALAGCKKRSLEVPTEPSAPVAAEAPRQLDLHKEDNTLKGSTARVEWLEIPLAFRPTPLDREQRRVFQADGVTMERVRDFLSQRMMTGEVVEGTRSVFYRKVLPPSGAADAAPLNVHLSQLDGRLTLEVEVTNYNPTPLPFEAAKAAAEADQKRAH